MSIQTREKVRVGIVGAGFVAQTVHLPFLKGIPSVDLVAIADVDQGKAIAMGRKYNIPVTSDSYDDLLKNENIDVIDICTPPFTHAEVARAAARRGKNVIVEKPMALTLNEALDMRNEIRATGTRLGVVLNLRYMPLTRTVLQVLNSGVIGDLHHVAATVHTYAPPGQWAGHPIMARYGVLYDFLPHVLDLITWTLQAFPCKVACRPTTEGMANAYSLMVELETPARRRCLATIDVKWTTATVNRIVVFYGSTRNLLVDLQDQFWQVTRGYVTPVGRLVELTGRTLSVARRLAKGRTSFMYGSMIYHRDLLQDFVRAFAQHDSPRVSIQDGLVHTAVIDAAVRSAEETREVDIEWKQLL